MKRTGMFGPRARAFLAAAGTFVATLSTAQAAVTVDQTPLTVQTTVAPDIMLMLDDSGSMAWNFMPDICYLSGVTCNAAKNDITGYTVTSDNTNAALINASNNGVYYNPAFTYSSPLTASGGSYANSPGLTNAWVDGYAQSTTVNITLYAPASSYSSTNQNYSGAYEAYTSGSGKSTGKSNIPFSTSTNSTYTVTVTKTGTNFTSTQCDNLFNADPMRTGSDSRSGTTCSWSSKYHFFEYATGGSNTVQYVAPYPNPSCSEVTSSGAWTSGWTCTSNPTNNGCGSQSSCTSETDTSGGAAPSGIQAGQNVANWFSYYRTRMLTAKTGLTTAIDDMAVSTRFGFGSIDGNNDNNLPASQATYNSVNMATVAPFDNSCVTNTISPCAKGQSGTQRANFWTWITGESGNSGTNLRSALDAVGQYYSSAGPWQNSANDTTSLACRQAYTVLTTDGFWNDSVTVSDYDSTSSSAITGPNGQSYTYTAAPPYSDSRANTLADVAMRYWKTDLRPTLSNQVPVASASGEDPAFWQHMVTFTIGLGFDPTGISPNGTTVDQIFTWARGGSTPTGVGANGSGFSWPAPAADSINNIADLAHAAVDGHGGFYSAKSPQAFSSGLTDALKRAQERQGTGASLAANSTTLQTGTVTYQALYYTGSWKGDLFAYPVDPTTGAISGASAWNGGAAAHLPAAASRTIYTKGASSNIQFTAANVGSLSTAQQNALGASATERQDRINYLRGDSSKEQQHNGVYRNRDNALGDIVDSQPVYVGGPDPNVFNNKSFSGSGTYVDFATDNMSRTALLWIAANDGMLHAFNAGTGVESYAYLPGAVITNGLADLSNPDYGTTTTVPHQFYNDGQLTVADAYLSGAWKTVLVGTTGRGSSKAVYALDITNPSAPSVLWERSSGDGLTNSGYIGQIIGQPVIAQTADGSWSVLIGNGYNSSQNKAALLQFNLSDGTLSVHTTNNTINNGLAAPAVWQSDNSNGISTTAYAGDLFGNVWSFDLQTATSTGTVVYTALDSSSNPQPITAGMLVGKDPDTADLWIFFGTGKYLTQADLSDLSVQTWYGLILSLGPKHGTEQAVTSSSTRTNLVQRQITAEQAANTATNTPGLRTITAAAVGDLNNKQGWYIDLRAPTGSGGSYVSEGERMVTPNQFQGILLLGTTRIPSSSDPCNPNGRGWILAINPFSGGNPDSAISNSRAAPTGNSGIFFDINGDRVFNSSDKLNGHASAGVGFVSIPNNPIFVSNTMLTSFDNASNSSILTSGGGGLLKRVSWREWIGQ